ncbi:MAG: rhodanese-related sulfurtransferase [Alphaproteobacteria bacterium]|nr:rhodanese-related sulfurtransferase [Alphaproteobacteria bacterium]
MEQENTWKVAALYRFVSLDGLPTLQARVKSCCLENHICGTLLLAPEGINGTIAGPEKGIENIMSLLDKLTGVTQGEVKYSAANEKPFRKMRVRLKKEIVTLKAPEADPTKQVGTYIEPKDWNNLINDPEVTLIDTRNTYETVVGMFEGAIDPEIETFTEFKDFVSDKMDPAKQKKVAMFCTGGIRCEKASSYMLAHGFEEVYHLKGGILKYLEEVPAQESKWNGDCFVFDKRVAVGQDLEESPYQLCYGCRFPLSPEDLQSPSYEKGVSCPHCIDTLSEEKAHAFRMRHQQMQQMGEEIPGEKVATS